MSSGNLTADRRYAYARSLEAEGDHTGGIDVMAQALELEPGWAEGRFIYAEMLQNAGRRDDAVTAYHHYLAADPADSMGAGARLALLTRETPASLSPAYVQRLFDQYAHRFDEALLGKLAYRAPDLLRAAITAAAPGQRFARAYDLGCGTGLGGAAIRDLTGWLAGVDLSPAMVDKARGKNIYDALESGDMIAGLNDLDAACDLMTAADVLVYIGDLTPVFSAVRNRLTADGFFVFSLQRTMNPNFTLGPDQRFSHNRAYVYDIAVDTGLTVVSLQDAVCRQEKGADVPGLIAVLRAI